MEQKTGFKELFLRLVAIVGLIAVLILGAWGIILLAFNLVGLFNGNAHFGSFFGNNSQNNATTTVVMPNTETPIVVQPAPVQKPPVTTPSLTPAPIATYTAAPQRVALYGLPDLAVSITSVTSLSSVQGRTVVQFTVSNIGTNVARSGWMFEAQLPLSPSPAYTYRSSGQQALNPGDKIAYTLTYDNPNYNQYNYNPNQVCTLQYPNYNCNNNYQYQQNQNTGTCYTYNGYQNVPGPCVTYDQYGNPIYSNTNTQNQNYYNQNYNTNYGTNYNYNTYYPYGGTITINLDPQNWVPESAEYNNSASRGF